MKSIRFWNGEIVERIKSKNQNYISTTMYSLYNFLPMSIFNQV